MAFCLDHHIMFHAEIERCWKCREESEKACADAGGHDFRPWHDMKCPDGVWEVRHCMTCGFGEDRKKPNDKAQLRSEEGKTQGYKDYRALVDALHKTFNDPAPKTCLHTWREGTCTTACGHTYHATHDDEYCGGCGKPIYAGWGARPALSDQEKEQA